MTGGVVRLLYADAGASGEPVGTTEQASSSGGFGRATLVVCPLVAVLQWRQEIERFTKPNTLKVSPGSVS